VWNIEEKSLSTRKYAEIHVQWPFFDNSKNK
jgi:hypothetical protein